MSSNIKVNSNSAIPLLDAYLIYSSRHLNKCHTLMLIAALLTIIKMWKQSQCALKNE